MRFLSLIIVFDVIYLLIVSGKVDYKTDWEGNEKSLHTPVYTEGFSVLSLTCLRVIYFY